MRVADWH